MGQEFARGVDQSSLFILLAVTEPILNPGRDPTQDTQPELTAARARVGHDQPTEPAKKDRRRPQR